MLTVREVRELIEVQIMREVSDIGNGKVVPAEASIEAIGMAYLSALGKVDGLKSALSLIEESLEAA